LIIINYYAVPGLKLTLFIFNNLNASYCVMSRQNLIESARAHPEVIAIGLEITLDPSRRRHYSKLVLMLADAAMQEIVRMMASDNLPPPGVEPDRPDDLASRG